METVLADANRVLDAVTTGSSAALKPQSASRYVTMYVVGGAGVGAGAVQLETAHDPAYTGTWAALGTPVTVVANTVAITQAIGSFNAIRARVSTTITGGTGSVYISIN